MNVRKVDFAMLLN